MTQFYPLRISDIRSETSSCKSIALAIPLELKAIFDFHQGQYLTFRQEINGEEIRRSYSICTAPKGGELRVAVKKVDDGRFSTFANDTLQIGDTLETMPPEGRFFTPLNARNAKHYVLFAAGSGITPIISIIKAVLEQEPESRVTLFYGNKTVDQIIFREELEALKNTFLHRFSLHYLLSQENPGSDLFFGRLDAEKCKQFCEHLIPPMQIDEVFLCGPEAMILGIREELLSQGVLREKIHLELFGTTIKKKQVKLAKEEGKQSEVVLTADGKTIHFAMKSTDESILDAALRQGADLPFACKGGVCCTCKAKILEGKVEMAVNYGLEEDEIAQNYILSCQAVPTTDKVTIDFDV